MCVKCLLPLVLGLGLLKIGPSAADTIWTSPITNAVTWTAAGSPHTWGFGDLWINAGGDVTIEPGAVVQMPSGGVVRVEAGARLRALGSTDTPIRFGGVSDAAPGGYVFFSSALESQFRFCHFTNLKGIRVLPQSPQGNHLFEHCVFRKFTDHAIYLENAPARILHCMFLDGASDKYGVRMYCSVFTDETCPTIWYNAFERNGLVVVAANHTTLAMNNWDFFRFNRVGGGTGIALGGGRTPGFQKFLLLDCDLGDASPSLHVYADNGWAGGVDGRIERCRLLSLTQYSQNVGGLTNLANNYWGTTNMDAIAAALFGGTVSTNAALPISTTNLFPQADVDGSDNGNLTRQADADLVKQAVVGLISLTPEQQAIADVDRNGVVDTRDALLIESYINGLMWKLPVP